MSKTATIGSLPQAFEMIKGMEAQGLEFGEDYREAGGHALAGVLEAGMGGRVGRHLEEMARRGEAGHSRARREFSFRDLEALGHFDDAGQVDQGRLLLYERGSPHRDAALTTTSS